MKSWIVKGNPAENDWDQLLEPGTRGLWHTFRRPKAVEALDRIFFWESSPKRRLIALGAFTNPDCGKDKNGHTLFQVEYATRRLPSPLTIEQLRAIPILENASFLKSGPAGTIFPISADQATAIIAALAVDNAEVNQIWPDVKIVSASEDDDLFGAKEANPKLYQHFLRERNRTIIDMKKKEVLSRTGVLDCEACGFNFEFVYGPRGAGFCEIHHLIPLSEAEGEIVTTLEDLAVLCSNCHRMIHRTDPFLSISGLRCMLPKPAQQTVATEHAG